MFAIVHTETKNFVGVWDRRPKLQRVERDEIALSLELLLCPGKDLLQSPLPLLEQRTHGDASLPTCCVCTTQARRTRINHCLFLGDTCAPGSIRTTNPVTHEHHRNAPLFITACI